ncbi:helix-turn-helix domain-containing protein [Aeromonas veronii]
MMNFSQRLEARMKELHVSAAELSRRTGISPAVVSRILSEPGREIRASSLMSIAKQLRVDPVWLYLGRSSSSLIRDIEEGPGMVPIWTMQGLQRDQTIDAWPHADTGRRLATEREGHLIAVEADSDQLADAGITPGAICLVDLNDNKPEHNRIMLAKVDNTFMLLRAIQGLPEWRYSVDDPRAGSLTDKQLLLVGKVIEIRLPS